MTTSSARARITKRIVDGLEAVGREYFRWDPELPGFGVRVQPSGTKSYVVKYRAGSGRMAPTRRMTLGPITKLTPDQARTLAKKALGAVAHGADPANERSAERKAELAHLHIRAIIHWYGLSPSIGRVRKAFTFSSISSHSPRGFALGDPAHAVVSIRSLTERRIETPCT
jgi:Arm DNA-binding domain